MDNDNAESKTNLIVNYLPQDMKDAEFEELFKKIGTMKSCKIVRNRLNGYSYGFGFVDFSTHEEALKAIDELNGFELNKKKIKVAFARPAGQDIKQANLYIKNVPLSWDQDDVKKVFEPYGDIIQVRVLGNNRGIAFVLFDLRKQAEDALEAMNGKTLDGCDSPLEIKFAADKKVEKNSNNNNRTSNNNNDFRGDRNQLRGGRRNNIGNNNNNNNNTNRDGRQSSSGQRNFYDRQQNSDLGNQQNQFNAIPYGSGNNQYNPGNNTNFRTMNNGSVGPVRPNSATRMNRYAPFQPVLASPLTQLATTPIAQPNLYMPTQQQPPQQYQQPQQTIPYQMLQQPQQQQINPMLNQQQQPGQMIGHAPQMAPQLAPQMAPQLAAAPMQMYGTTQVAAMAYAPMTQNAMNNIYTVASNNLTNAANMQPTQFGQSMASNSSMRNNNHNNNNSSHHNHNSNSGGDEDGVTLFVYNIGPDADEMELKTMFQPYGQVVKCNVVRKTPGGETKGFGFVTLKDRDQANLAISGMNGSLKDGRTLQVSLKR